MNKQAFSEVYGMNREEIVALIGGEDAARKLTMRFLRAYPAVVQFIGNRLKKQRARMMVEALQKGKVERGNVGVRVDDKFFMFSYRGTDILMWDTEPTDIEDFDIIECVTAHDHTSSTRAQRKAAREAIEEFQNVVQGL